jgi:putative FmdB family regulatory protein
MPIYEYKCCACGHEFEELVFKENAAVDCPACKSRDTDKLMSACRHKAGSGGGDAGDYAGGGPSFSSSSGGGGCSGCSGGSCASCH